MASSFKTSSDFDCSADDLFSLHADPEFQSAKALALGAHTATCEIESATDTEVRLRLETAREGFGGRGKEVATMRMTLDRETRGSTWSQTVQGYERRASVEGVSVVSEVEGGGARLTVSGTINIRIPLVGRVIEGKILGAIQKIADRETAFIRDRLRALKER